MTKKVSGRTYVDFDYDYDHIKEMRALHNAEAKLSKKEWVDLQWKDFAWLDYLNG